MARKKLDVMRNMSEKELNQKVLEAQKAMFENRVKLATGQLEDTAALWKNRKEIARLKTFLTQKNTQKSAAN